MNDKGEDEVRRIDYADGTYRLVHSINGVIEYSWCCRLCNKEGFWEEHKGFGTFCPECWECFDAWHTADHMDEEEFHMWCKFDEKENGNLHIWNTWESRESYRKSGVWKKRKSYKQMKEKD